MRTERLGELQARVTGGTDREGGGDGPVVVLMHGFGAPGTDLVDLWRVLSVPREVRFVFPEAPLSLGPGYGDGRAWWMLDVEALERRARGETTDRSGEVPDGLATARDQVRGLLTGVLEQLAARPEQIVLGGFSQGAMLACDVALHDERPLAGLALLSSTLIAADLWTPRMPQRASLPILMTHGERDPLLPYADAQRLRELWEGAGAQVEFVRFSGGHEIPPIALEALGRFIASVTAPAADTEA